MRALSYTFIIIICMMTFCSCERVENEELMTRALADSVKTGSLPDG